MNTADPITAVAERGMTTPMTAVFTLVPMPTASSPIAPPRCASCGLSLCSAPRRCFRDRLSFLPPSGCVPAGPLRRGIPPGWRKR